VLVYRIGSSRHPANDGTGASLYPGRWNPLGVPVIYTAQTASLCALEILSSARELAGDYVVVEIEIPDDVAIGTLQDQDLPADWNAEIYPKSTRNIGRDWVASGRTAVLSVPSTANPYERNFVLNPAHADFSRLSFREPQPFAFSDRLRRRV
jgi:RES domain-containing protein